MFDACSACACIAALAENTVTRDIYSYYIYETMSKCIILAIHASTKNANNPRHM